MTKLVKTNIQLSNSQVERQAIVDKLQAFDKDLKIAFNKAEKDCNQIEKLETLNATAISLIINEVVKLRINFNAINVGDDDLPLDLGSLRKHIFKTCNDGVTPNANSALYKTIQRGCIMGAITETHSEHVKRAVAQEIKKGKDAKGNIVQTNVDKLDKNGNKIYDGNILAPRNVVHKTFKRKDENNKWEDVVETRTDLVKVPLGEVQNVNRHYNPPAVKGPDKPKVVDQQNPSTKKQILNDLAHKIAQSALTSLTLEEVQLVLTILSQGLIKEDCYSKIEALKNGDATKVA